MVSVLLLCTFCIFTVQYIYGCFWWECVPERNFHVLNWVDDVAVQDIEGKEVFLGDQKLDNDDSFKMLKAAINKGSKKDESQNYVVFTPELKRFTADGKYVIEYSIHFTSSLVDFSNQILPVSRGRLNPSPPY